MAVTAASFTKTFNFMMILFFRYAYRLAILAFGHADERHWGRRIIVI
jgi:hypothetical protein